MTHPEDHAHRAAGDDAAPDGPPRDEPPLGAEWQAAARQYNAAPAVPADAMWAAIQARRRPAAAAPPELHVVHLPRGRGVVQRPPFRWRWTPAAAAAVLLVAAGVGIGRYTAGDGDAPRVAAAGGTPAPDTALRAAPAPPAGSTTPRLAAAAPDRTPDRAPNGAPERAPGRAPELATADAAPSAPLRAVAQGHLERAEALLTGFATAAPATAGAPPDSAWARDLLTTTRLLLDSPAGRDPARRALLEDLELVLAQIARLPRADTAEERVLIGRAIRRGDLMARLRAPAPPDPVRPAPRTS